MNRSTLCSATAARPASLRARVKPLAFALALVSAAGSGNAVALTGQDGRATAWIENLMSGVPALAPGQRARAVPSHPAMTWSVTSCDDDGPGTLRDVVDHWAGDGDTIDMTQLTCGKITLTTGSIVTFANNLTIEGPGTTHLSVDGNYAIRPFTHIGSGTLALSNFSIWHGYTRSSGTDDALGGGVASIGTVSLDHVSVKYCQAAAAGTGFARGGGVFGQSVQADHSMIKYNDARANGGYAVGGGVAATGPASFDYTTVSGNQAFANALWRSAGGGVLADYGGALRQSTVSKNEAGQAGGVVFVNGQTAISQSTISGNSSTYSFVGSGAHVNSAFTVLVENSTITDNIERNPGNNRYGAGLHLNDNTHASVVSTILAGNRMDDGTSLLWFSDVGGGTNSTISGDHDLFGWSGLAAPADTLYTIDPKLGPLEDNGGVTYTHALRPTSPAVNAGNNITGVPVDQRGTGFARVIGANVDIGAFEFNVDDLIFADDFD
jgi:hypothetical protein